MSPANVPNEDKKDFQVPPLRLEDINKCAKVESLLKGLRLTEVELKRMQDVFRLEMVRGISEQESSLQMENTYIPELPDGTEEGLYLALDLGGTNFRVILLELLKGDIVREEVKHYHISDDMRVGCGIEI